MSSSSDDGRPLDDALLAAVAIRVPGYRLLHRIGEGGQGVVHAAERIDDGHPVAIKLLRHGALAAPRERVRMRREVRAMMAIKHPGIVQLFDAGRTVDGHDFLVMELIDGQNLDERLGLSSRPTSSLAPLDLITRLALCRDICRAVGAAHAAGVVHRDLGPANILIDEKGPHVLDFGLARTPFDGFLDAHGAALTASGSFLGRVRYASPEQALGQSHLIDARSDVYSLGVIIYEVLSGTLPYRITDNLLLDAPTIRSVAPAPLRVVPLLPGDGSHARSVRAGQDLEAVVRRALRKSPSNRYATAAELAEALAACTHQAVPSTGTVRRRPTRRQVMGAAVTGVLTLGALDLYRRARSTATPAATAPRPATAPAPRLLCVLTGGPRPAGRLEFHPKNTSIRVAAIAPDPGSTVWSLDDFRQLGASATGTKFDTYDPTGNVIYSPGHLFLPTNGLVIDVDTTKDERPCFSADGQRVAVIREWHDPRVRVYRTRDGVKLFEQRFRFRCIAQFDLSADGRRVAAAGGSPQTGLQVWDVDSAKELGFFDWRGDAKTFVRFCRASLCAFDMPNGTAAVFEAANGRRRLFTGITAGAGTKRSRLHVCRDEFVVSWHCRDADRVVLWSVERSKPLRTLQLAGPATTTCAAHRRSGRFLTADASGAVRVWETQSPTSFDLEPGHPEPVTFVALSPDGSLAASSSADGTVRVWQLPPA